MVLCSTLLPGQAAPAQTARATYGTNSNHGGRNWSTYIAIRWPHDLRVLQLDGDADMVGIKLLLPSVPFVHLRILRDLTHVACEIMAFVTPARGHSPCAQPYTETAHSGCTPP